MRNLRHEQWPFRLLHELYASPLSSVQCCSRQMKIERAAPQATSPKPPFRIVCSSVTVLLFPNLRLPCPCMFSIVKEKLWAFSRILVRNHKSTAFFHAGMMDLAFEGKYGSLEIGRQIHNAFPCSIEIGWFVNFSRDSRTSPSVTSQQVRRFGTAC